VSLSDSQAGGPPTASPSPMLGKYRILRVIARSNDVVYEAIDPGINRRVAVKELALSPNLSGQQRRERIERFYREAKAAGNLSHPNIVTVHEVGHEGDRHYIAMEYLEGPSLRDILRMRNTLSIKEALNVALQLTDALGYAHGQGVVHRDVKPDNIHLVVPNDAVKLTDFGIARILADPAITSTGQVFGTPSYMSPEQIMSKEVDHRTDIFSLGVVLYEMIVGKKPFIGDSVITITYHIMNSQPAIPNTLPSGVYNLISRALTKDPELRYQSMASMAADLHAEIAFSDSPYHRTIPPGAMTFQEIAEEQTAMVERGELPSPNTSFPQSTGGGHYAPSTGIENAVAGGPVGAATSVTPMAIPRVTSQEDPSRSALTLVASVAGVVLLILLMVFAFGKAYEVNRTDNEAKAALVYYNRAQSEMSAGETTTALSDYKRALEIAPPGSLVAQDAQLALNQQPPSQTPPVSGSSNDVPEPGPAAPTDNSGATAVADDNSSTSTPTTPTATGSDVADADLAAANNYLATGDQTDALTQLIGADEADPTGDSGKRAASQLASIYSQQADAAIKAGQTKTALDDWHLVLKYAPADPMAAQATQNIGIYSQSGTQTNSGGTDSGSTTPNSPLASQ